ncbi:DPP IV N-terminal domain-containing protein [Jiangella alba]|uniref:Dipeptidyl aminopeptidase/acylaminoacyl peptidase n=1 Tax=Jiangella alba TaxID=561176 RepID=A0A1H5LD37_9ACTN|nr:DPP IV N-terminal domain-containing protein [Jiangella alba]SEE74467.1 Dipeptidyl aminopeptidase/acylaminoacyl peptidase [Jiangella alba]
MTTTDLAARYARAEALLPHHLRGLITSPQVRPEWIPDTDTFWYRNVTSDGAEFVLVDAETACRRPAFDHERVAAALGGVLGEEADPAALPFDAIEPRDGAVRVAVGEQLIEISLDDYTATRLGPIRPGEAPSPDGRWAVVQRDHDLYLRDTVADTERRLTTDGVDGHAYGGMNDQVAALVMQENLGFTQPPLVVWSPDSTRFITHRLDQRGLDFMHLVRSAPFDGGRPTLLSYRYGLPGDENLPTAEFFVFDAASGESVQAKSEPIFMPFVPAIAYGWVWWSDDGSAVHWLANDRGDHHVGLYRLDPDTGAVSLLVEESSDSQILYGPQQMDRNVRTLSTGEVLWWSQRSGWGHLYRYGADGTVTTLTSGDWLVRDVVSIDEDARRVVFTGAGREPGSDPYLRELYSVSLDGGDITAITADGLDHDPRPSPSGRYVVDVAARWDVPAVSVLRDRTGAVVLELERADASALAATGWSAPERALVKAADGETDLYCAVYRPHDLDPDRTYPVLDCVYPGPQMSCAPLRFPLSGGPNVGASMAFNVPESFAALGFVVVVVDGRGSAMRSRAFQDQARVAGGTAFVDDHVTAIRQLAAARPWMDLDRVGIYGYSAGGYASARALLQAPDFYQVAVSSGGNHDNRINHSWWGEKYFGLTGDFDFAAQANASLAEDLTGRLLLVHGEMDDNATPHGTMRLVDALIRANKDFDLLIVPNADHHMMVNRAYFLRRRWDYFVRHLMGSAPPPYRVGDVPIEVYR